MNYLTEAELCQLTHDDAGRVPQSLVIAIIMEESGAQPDAESNMGAIGLMQIMQKFHPSIDLRDPKTNVQVGCRILESDYRYLNHIRLNLDPRDPIDWSLEENVRRTLRGFNAGCGTVVWHDQNPAHLWPDESNRYVDNIVELWKKGYC